MRAASRLTKMSVSESSATMTTFLRFCVRRASVMSGTSIQIRARIDEVKAIVIDESEFGDLTGAATSTVEMVVMQLESLLSTVVMREEQAEAMRKQREEHEAALRKQQEELEAQRAAFIGKTADPRAEVQAIVAGDKSVDIVVSRLRKKLEPLDCIKTLRNVGYSLALRRAAP